MEGPQHLLHKLLTILRPYLRRKLVLISGILLCTFIFLSLIHVRNERSRNPYFSPSDRLKSASPHAFDSVEIDLHLLVPATEPNLELCKGILSALVLGYPPPTLINWGKEFSSQTLRYNGSHIGKITGVLDYLDGIASEWRDQLVLMVDGYDVWFQLPPSVLHSRFRTIDRQLFDLATARLGSRTVERAHISQSIIFSAQKNCGPGKQQVDQVACYGQPDSPVRQDLYGTDTDIRDESTRLPLHVRPSFLNSGFVAGPVHAMKSLMLRAKQKADENENHEGRDQHVFNEIFGEQEYFRELQRQRYRSAFQKVSDAFWRVLGLSDSLLTDAHPSHAPANVTDEYGPYEYGIGLDYGLELVHSVVFSEFDGRLLTYGQQQAVAETLSGAGMPDPPRVHDLPADVANDTSGVDWWQQPLWTNVWTGSVPITIHMNGFKSMRQSLWDQMWFFKTSRERIWLKRDKVALKPDGEPLSWDDVCQQYESEIFDTAA